MTREEVAHVLRAARALTNETEFVLVGSQAAHAGIGNLPPAMQQSGELAIYPLRHPELADVIDGAIGEGRRFTALSATMRRASPRRRRGCRASGVGARSGSPIRSRRAQ